MLFRAASALSLVLFSLIPAALAFDVKVVAVTRNGSIPVDPATIKLDPRPVTPSQLQRLNKTEVSGARGSRNAGNVVGYSGNWCGASQHTTTADRFKSVSGFFTVPDLSLRPATGTPQFVASWIGIDGANCATALVQAGATTEISANGQQTSHLWFEWIPDAAYNIPNLSASPGDIIYVEITASSSSKATVLVENLSLPASAPMSGVQIGLSNGAPLCRIDAEWIVENFKVNGDQTSFGRFEDVYFQACEARKVSGGSLGIDGASMIYLQNNGPNPNCFAYPYDNSVFWAQSS